MGEKLLLLAAMLQNPEPGTPENLCRNGKLFYDTFVYQPTAAPEVQPGTHDYAVSMGYIKGQTP